MVTECLSEVLRLRILQFRVLFVRAFSKLLQAIAKSGLRALMSNVLSYVLCLVSYVFHIAFAYVLMFRDAYVLMFCDLIFESNRRVARSCSITIKLHRVICSYSCSCSYPYSFLHLRNLHTYRRIKFNLDPPTQSY